MEIKDKLTARQVAMQMATETMTALIPVARGEGYDINNHINIARGFYDWIVGNAELPEVYDQNSQTGIKVCGNLNHTATWFPIMPIDGKVPDYLLGVMREHVPLYLRAKDGFVKVVGCIEEFDILSESRKMSDYTDYAFVYSPDPKCLLERDKEWAKEMGIKPVL